jgi:hypothetical protein
MENAIDNFLMYYVASKEKMDHELSQLDRKYRHITSKWDPSYMNRIKAVYIVHKIFRENGLLRKYLNHREVMELSPAEFAYLQFNLEHPMRFSYARIIEKPEKDFFLMEDVFTDEVYLLHSPGMSTTLKDFTPQLWFNLINFNGECWQTYGPILWFNAFDADDIFFYGTEIDIKITDNEDLMKSVSDNPMPYYLLLSSSDLPQLMSRGHHMRNYVAYDPIESPPLMDAVKDSFEIGWNADIYQYKNKEIAEPQHFALAYFIEKEQLLVRYAMTEFGFRALTDLLLKAGLNIKPDEDVSVSVMMITTIERLLGKKISFNEFEELFIDTPQETPERMIMLDKVNAFIGLILPYINQGRTPDIEALAKEAGISIEEANSVWEQVGKDLMRKLGKL